jgi:hypothetical protein
MRVIPPQDCKKSGHHQFAVDTTTPTGRSLFQMIGVFAEFERTMIRSVVGLRRCRAELAKGTGILKTARMLGVGTGEGIALLHHFTRSKIENRSPGGDLHSVLRPKPCQRNPGIVRRQS